MPIDPRRPPQLSGQIFRGSEVVAEGVLTRGDLRSSGWRRLFRDVYADANLVVSHHARCAAAMRWLVPAGAAIAGRAAAALYDAVNPDPGEPVDIVLPAGVRYGPVSGLRVHASQLSDGDVRDRGGLPVTTPERTCWDLSRWLDRVEAVTVVDRLIARRLVTIPALRDYALSRAGHRGWRMLLRVVSLADGGAESTQESRARVRLMLAGLPRPVTQYVIEQGGRFVARVDLAWPEYKVAVEYDGLWHGDPVQFQRDRKRLNRLLGNDWIVLHLTAERLRDDFDGFVVEVQTALRARRSRRRAT